MSDTTPQTSMLGRIATAATAIAATGLSGMVLVQGWQVIARYALNASPSWTEPVTLLLLSTTLSFGAAVGVHTRSHFSFPLFVQLLPKVWQYAFARFSSLIILGIGVLLALGGGTLVLDGIDIKMAGAPLPQGALFMPLCAGGALMALFALPQLWRPTLEAN